MQNTSPPLKTNYSYRGWRFVWDETRRSECAREYLPGIIAEGAAWGTIRWLPWDERGDWREHHFRAVVDAGGIELAREIVFNATGWAFNMLPEHVDRWLVPEFGEIAA